MALVTETLFNQLLKQVDAHGTVVWFDPERAYLDLAQSLSSEAVAGAAIHRYKPEQGFVWLRRRLEPLWEKGTAPPRLILYVPLAQAETGHALVEFEVGGGVLRPGQQPPERNTALDAVARRALASVLPPAALEKIASQAKAGQLSLAELDELAEKSVKALTGVIATVFGSGNVSDVAIRFLSDPALDAEIEARQALGSLAGLLTEALGIPFSADQGLRAQLARQVLVTDLIEALGDEVPQALHTFPLTSRPVARQETARLAQMWRNRRDLADSYVHWAGRVQAEVGLGSLRLGSGQALDLTLDALTRTETFLVTETRLQEKVEKALVQRPSARLVELAKVRLVGFWSVQRPEVKIRWQVIATAGQVLVEAARVESALKGKAWSAAALLSNYAYGDEPWCDLDTVQRHLERDFYHFDFDPQQHGTLRQLVARARQRYAAISDRLAELFTGAYADDHFELPGVLLQADVYQEIVAPATKTGRVAYILVDALRFEMARELLTILESEWTHDLTPALATPPTVTEIGMAALLPGAEMGLAVVPASGNRLAAVVAGKTLKTRQDRLAHFEDAVEGSIVVTKLNQLAPLSDTRLGQALKSADVVLVTATEEIDSLCENNPALARGMLDNVLDQLRRGIKSLLGWGLQTVVITADHGYLFGEELSVGQKIDAPGGKAAALKRRVWVGQGGAELPGVLRAPISAFGVGGELEIATPRNLSCFKVKGGGTKYFHGGLSLPELVIPVLTVRSSGVSAPASEDHIQWTLALGSHTISTRFVSVTIEGHSTELWPIEPPMVRVEVLAQAGGPPISVPVSASYGFQETTRDVQLASDPDAPQAVTKNTITLMITETPAIDEVTVYLLDATTGISLARLDRVPFAIAF